MSAGWRAPALGALAGALYFLACPPYGLSALACVALVPLVLALRTAGRGSDAVRAGWVAGIVACAGGYAWIADTAHRFWEVPWVFAAFLLLVFASFAELHFTVFALVWWKGRRRFEAAPAAAGAALFTLCERFVPRIFPDKLGHTQVDAGPLPFAAALGGTHGLSFGLAWVAAAVAALVWAWRTPARRRCALELAVAVAAMGGLAVYGAQRAQGIARTAPERTLDVLIVQPNIGDPEEIVAQQGSVTQAIDSTLTAYIGMTRSAIGATAPDLVVWPETAVPTVPRPRTLERLERLVAERGIQLVFGAYDIERVTDQLRRTYNAAFHMDAMGQLRGRYAKNKLLVFAEYVPLSDRIPGLLNLLPAPGEFSPGPGPVVFTVHDVALAPLICYELLFPDVVRRALRGGGTVIVNLTNDYWFGRGLEPEQHLALCRMCAFETGRPIIRATNTGISATIDGSGVVRARTRVWEPGVVRDRVPIPPMSWTPFTRWGDLATAAVVAAGMVLGGLARGRRPAVRH